MEPQEIIEEPKTLEPQEPSKVEAPVNAEPAQWFDSLDPELRDNPNVRKFKDVNALAKSYTEAVKKLGQKGAVPLPKDATKEQREAYNAIRRGENIKTPDDYSWGKGTADAEDPSVKILKQSLFDAGADDYMASEILNTIRSYDDAEGETTKANVDKFFANEATRLREAWGEDYATNVKANEILMSKYPEAMNALRVTGADKTFGVQMMLRDLNSKTADAEVRLSNARTVSFSERLAEIESSDAYKTKWHPKHEQAVRERAELITEHVRNRNKI